MAESLKNVYASALYDICDERNICEDAFDQMQFIKNIFDQNEDLTKLLKSPLISIDEKKNILDKIFSDSICDTIYDFLCLVTEKRRAEYISEICSEFVKIYFERSNIIEVDVVTAEPLNDRLKNKLKEKLEKTINKKVIMKSYIDKTLIGGIIIRYDNLELDSSIKGKLDRLKEQIDSVIA